MRSPGSHRDPGTNFWTPYRAREAGSRAIGFLAARNAHARRVRVCSLIFLSRIAREAGTISGIEAVLSPSRRLRFFGVGRTQRTDQLPFFAAYFVGRCYFRFQNYFATSSHVLPGFSAWKIRLDQPLVGTSEVRNRICQVAANIYFAVRPSDFIDD